MNRPLRSHSDALSRNGLLEDLHRVRDLTVRLCDPLSAEDCVVQSAPETSPAKWHLAHTTWFLENFLLIPYLSKYRRFHPPLRFLFHFYYENLGQFHPPPPPGPLFRPPPGDIPEYPHYADHHL